MGKNIDDEVIKVLDKHKIDYTYINELEFRMDLSEALTSVLKSYTPTGKTIEEARREIFAEETFRKGSICPLCSRKVQLKKLSISRSQIGCLMMLYRLHLNNNDWERYFHMSDDINVPVFVGGNWAKLRYWGLIEEKAKQRGDGKDTLRSGFWRLTDKGKAFLKNLTVVPKYITLYNAEFRGFKDENDTISVKDVFDKKKDFSYSEVVNWDLDMWNKNIENIR